MTINPAWWKTPFLLRKYRNHLILYEITFMDCANPPEFDEVPTLLRESQHLYFGGRGRTASKNLPKTIARAPKKLTVLVLAVTTSFILPSAWKGLFNFQTCLKNVASPKLRYPSRQECSVRSRLVSSLALSTLHRRANRRCRQPQTRAALPVNHP
jgi:hypothetical protein